MSWLHQQGKPIPAGYSLAALLPVADELGAARLQLAEGIVGRELARGMARKLGPYQLSDELVLRLELEGLKVGEDGELPCLTPSRWGRYPEALRWEELLGALKQEGVELAGLLLTEAEAESFRRFLLRRGVREESPAARIVELARHYFHGQPLNVLVRPSPTH